MVAAMKSISGALLLSILAVVSATAAPSPEEEAVLQAERAGCLAYQHGDAAGIGSFLAEGYTLTNSKGEISTRADDLAEAASGKVHYDVFENYDMKARIYDGTTAIVLGRTRVKGNAEGKPIDIIVQFTDTLVKEDGHWRLAAGHVSRLKE